MEKDILIAVDNSANAKKVIEYAVKIRPMVQNLHYTLLNIQPKVSEFLIEDSRKDPRARSSMIKIMRKNRENSLAILDECRSLFINAGVNEDIIETVTLPMVRGTVKDILDYAGEGRSNAIVMGNRGVDRLTEAFSGSITNSVLEHTKNIPVWAVGGAVNSNRLMMAIDGSESSLKAIDHVAFMLSGNRDIQITLLHVAPKLRDYCSIDFDIEDEVIQEFLVKGDRKCVESFYLHAWQRLKKAGLSYDQFEIREIESTLQIGRIIVDEAKKGKFGTLVIGRRGLDNSFFIGSVSRYVLMKASNCAVWLVP